MSKFSKIILIIAAFLVSFQSYAYYTVVREVHNQSHQPWIVGFPHGEGAVFSSHCNYAISCQVMPGEFAQMFLASDSQGGLRITDSNNNSKYFKFYTKTDYAYIYHKGSTGSVDLNEPEDGDVIISGDNW